MKTMKNYEFKVDVSKFPVDKVKDILWQLYYSPEDAFKRLHVTEKVEPQMLVKELLKERQNLLFGQEQAFLSTEGVDLGIKSAIVRDVILERCHMAVEEEDHCIEKAVKLLRTEDNGEEAAHKRLIGGLKAIGFKNKEANYLVKVCNLYPVSLLLDRLCKTVAETTPENVAPVEEESSPVAPVLTNVPASSDFIANIVSNKELVDKLLLFVTDEESLEGITQKFESMKLEVNRLGNILMLADQLEQAGVSFNELIAKRKKVESLFEAINGLAVA